MGTCMAALLMAGAATVTYDDKRDESATAHLTNVADLIGASSSAAFQFRTHGSRPGAHAIQGHGVDAARIDLAACLRRYGRSPNAIPEPFSSARYASSTTLIVSRPILLRRRAHRVHRASRPAIANARAEASATLHPGGVDGDGVRAGLLLVTRSAAPIYGPSCG